MSAHFREIRDVTDMIPLSIFVHIFVLHLASTERFDSLKRLEDRTTVRPPATDVIHLAAAGSPEECMGKTSYIQRMDVVAHLFSFIAIDPIEFPLHVALYEVTEEPVQLDSTVVWAGQATAPEATGIHAEIPTILLHHHIGCHFGSTKDAVLALVDGKLLADPADVSRVVIVPACIELPEPDEVGPVPVNLVRAHVDERSLWRMLTHRFEQVQRAAGVDVKVVKWTRGGRVVHW